MASLSQLITTLFVVQPGFTIIKYWPDQHVSVDASLNVYNKTPWQAKHRKASVLQTVLGNLTDAMLKPQQNV